MLEKFLKDINKKIKLNRFKPLNYDRSNWWKTSKNGEIKMV